MTYWKHHEGGKMKRIVLLLTMLVAFPEILSADELFRWQDADGKMHYSDTAPINVDNVTRKKMHNEEQVNEMPYAVKRAHANFPVTLYVGETCGTVCNQARNLLNKRGVPFDEKTVRTVEEVAALKKLTNTDRVPVLVVGKSYVRGFLTSKWNTELDAAGYEKIASYRQRIAQSLASQKAAASADKNDE